jgi:hypothetical protein
MLSTPIVLFLFKRKDTLSRIFARLKTVKPKKIYLLSDGPRTPEELIIIEQVREYAESLITWECEIIKRYSETNIGVYKNLGLGARWIFSIEECAIFLEDDNLPEVSFFKYCEEMLERYRDDDRILWVCGTNYLQNYAPSDGSSYMFTKHSLPCGWASWSNKFLEFYDHDLSGLSIEGIESKIKYSYQNKALYKQEMDVIKKTQYFLNEDISRASWDRQMVFSLRRNSQFGISPAINQIHNIGVDHNATHGANKAGNTMTDRFCGIPTSPIKFPLIHPAEVLPDDEYENNIGDIILYPLKTRILVMLARFVKPILGIQKDQSMRIIINQRIQKFKDSRAR